eukprot:1161553-Pelagomonas_calceolata.AAC.4
MARGRAGGHGGVLPVRVYDRAIGQGCGGIEATGRLCFAAPSGLAAQADCTCTLGAHSQGGVQGSVWGGCRWGQSRGRGGRLERVAGNVGVGSCAGRMTGPEGVALSVFQFSAVAPAGHAVSQRGDKAGNGKLRGRVPGKRCAGRGVGA